jgi:glutathione S-transferase
MALELMNGPTSPFGRTSKVVALELGIDVDERVIDVYSADFLDQWNPLRLIPTLIVDGEQAIYDSRTICAYFDAVSAKPTIFPAGDWSHETRVALAIGVMEAGLQRRMEIIRKKDAPRQDVIEKLEIRIMRSLNHMESQADAITAGQLRMDQIASACALEYTDYRFSNTWRPDCPKLAVWLADFSQRPAMIESRPSE